MASPALSDKPVAQLSRVPRLPILDHPHHVNERPKRGRHACRERRSNSQALMDADEIVVHEVNRDRVGMVLGLFREAVG